MMQMKKYLFLFVLLIATRNPLTGQVIFSGFHQLVRYADSTSLLLKSNDLKYKQAQRAKIAALYGIFDINGSLSGSYTNNTSLPVNLFPAEILGGQPGTFQEVKLGVQYVTNANAYVEVKLVNPQGWKTYSVSSLQDKLVENENSLSRKDLHENLATTFFNIVTLQEQLNAARLHLQMTDSLYRSIQSKYHQGIVSFQDVSEIRILTMDQAQTAEQIRLSIDHQVLILKTLCDIPEEITVIIEGYNSNSILLAPAISEPANLTAGNALLKEKYATLVYRQNLSGYMPVLSFYASHSVNQFNTERSFPYGSSRWFPGNYIGFRLSIPVPSSQHIAKTSQSRFEALIAKNNSEQARILQENQNRQLQLEYEKSTSRYKSNNEIFKLREEVYFRNLKNYEAGIVSIENITESFHALVKSRYNLIASAAEVMLIKEKISINNKIR